VNHGSVGGSVRSAAVALLLATAALAHPGYLHEIDRLTGEIAAQPSRVDLYVKRAEYERRALLFEEALADLDRAEAIDAGIRAIRLERGLTLSALGSDAEADAVLTAYLDNGPPCSVGLAERGRVRERLGRHVDALRDYTRSLELEPDPDVILLRGRLLERDGNLAAAASAYREGYERTRAVSIRREWLRVEVDRGNYRGALALIDEEIARRPFKADSLLDKAVILERAGLGDDARRARDQAVEESTRAVASRPTAIHLVSRARALAASGRMPEAIQDLETAVSKSPQFAAALDLLAAYRSGGREEAKP